MFVTQYHADRSVARLVFDPYRNDLGTYQARELSYFVDYVDAQAFGALLRRGYRIFVPLSGVLASILTVVVFLRGARRYVHVPAVTALLLLLTYLTNYAHLVTMGMLYRSAKPLLPPLVTGLAFYVMSHLRADAPSETRRTRWAPALVFVILCVMSWLDRQGFFLTLVACAALALSAFVIRRGWDLAMAAAAAIVVMALYNFVAAPALVEYLHGYRPSFEYQRLPIVALADPSIWRHAIALVLQAGALLAGGVAPRVFGIVLVVVALVAASAGWRPRRQDLPWILVGLSQVVLFALMIARHPPVFEYVDHRVWYYPMALQALCLVGALVFVNRLLARAPALRAWTVNAILALAIVGNVASWDDYLRLQLRSRWFPVMYEQNLALKASLAEGRMRWYLDAAHQRFYEFCRMLEPPTR